MAMDIWIQLHLERVSNLPRKWRLSFQHNRIVSANSTAETDNLLSVWCSCERYHRLHCAVFHLVKNIKLDDTDPVVFPVNFYLLLRLQNRLNDWINSCQYSIKNITLANMLLCSVLLLLSSYCGVDSFESCVAALARLWGKWKGSLSESH